MTSDKSDIPDVNPFQSLQAYELVTRIAPELQHRNLQRFQDVYVRVCGLLSAGVSEPEIERAVRQWLRDAI